MTHLATAPFHFDRRGCFDSEEELAAELADYTTLADKRFTLGRARRVRSAEDIPPTWTEGTRPHRFFTRRAPCLDADAVDAGEYEYYVFDLTVDDKKGFAATRLRRSPDGYRVAGIVVGE